MKAITRAFALAFAFAFIAIAVAQIIMAQGREAGAQHIDRTREPFIAGLKGRFS